MSAVEIYAIRPNGEAVDYGDVGGAMACAPLIWSELCGRYLNDPYGYLVKKTQDRLWRLFYEPGPISQTDRICLGFTFDDVWVKRENLPGLADALEEFWKGLGKDYVPTIPAVVEKLRAAIAEDIRGVCFNQTSVNGNPWEVLIWPEGADTKEDDPSDRRPFNFDRDAAMKPALFELFEAVVSSSVR